jgi:type IV pilus assembly protein PilB
MSFHEISSGPKFFVDQGEGSKTLAELGFDQGNLRRFEKLIHRSSGIILVTGPRGSGRTTTLYAALRAINSLDRNIGTVEDPVAGHLKWIRQTEVNSKTGSTFTLGLGPLLKWAPDVMMIGSLENLETAERVVQAALMGHLVFLRVDVLSAAGALTRLIEIGVDPFLVSSTVVGVLAQRVAQRVCKHCAEFGQADEDFLKRARFPVGEKLALRRGKGCNQCNGSGYCGRVGIFELIMVTSAIRRLLVRQAREDDIRRKATQEGTVSLFENGLRWVTKGAITPEELVRVTRKDGESQW